MHEKRQQDELAIISKDDWEAKPIHRLLNVVESILQYAAPAWVRTMDKIPN